MIYEVIARCLGNIDLSHTLGNWMLQLTSSILLFSGFNSTETKIRTPDGKVWKEEEFHNLSREIYRDLSQQFAGKNGAQTFSLSSFVMWNIFCIHVLTWACNCYSELNFMWKMAVMVISECLAF